MKKIVLYFILFIISNSIYAQKPSQQIKKGNKEYSQEKYSDAEELYRKALNTPNKWEQEAMFNLSNSLLKQDKYEEAEELLQQLSLNEKIKNNNKAQVYHNLGNAQLKQQKYDKSIQSYIESLKLQPNDEDTRYNLSYAMKMLQQQQQQQNNQNNQENQENQENQDKEEQEDKKDDKKNNQEDKQKDKQNEQEKQQNEQQLSPQDMERMLNALSNKDKETLEELREQKIIKTEIEKDW